MKPRLTENLITASECRITPDGWMWARFGDIAEFQNGRAFPGKEYCTEGTRLLRPGNLFADGSVRWTEKNTQCLPLRWADDHPAMIVRGCPAAVRWISESSASRGSGGHGSMSERHSRHSPGTRVKVASTTFTHASGASRREAGGEKLPRTRQATPSFNSMALNPGCRFVSSANRAAPSCSDSARTTASGSSPVMSSCSAAGTVCV